MNCKLCGAPLEPVPFWLIERIYGNLLPRLDLCTAPCDFCCDDDSTFRRQVYDSIHGPDIISLSGPSPFPCRR
jgi:hypothetical protein